MNENRLIDRLKVPKIWDKEHRVCPRKRLVLAVLLYRQPFKSNTRYRTISDIAKSLGWNRTTVRDHIAELLRWKYVVQQDGSQYDVVKRSNYSPLNTGGKEWWADYAWDWLGSDQYADCTEQYVLKVRSEYPSVGTTRIAKLCGVSRRRVRDILDGGGTLKKCTRKPQEQQAVEYNLTPSETTAELEEKQYRARKKIAFTEKKLAEQPVTIDRMAVATGTIAHEWILLTCPERWQELCPGEDRTVYPITSDTRRWYHETYGTVRQCG